MVQFIEMQLVNRNVRDVKTQAILITRKQKKEGIFQYFRIKKGEFFKLTFRGID
jgi:hypothetical protein